MRHRARRWPGRLLLAAGGLAALGVALSLWMGPPPMAAMHASMGLCMQTSRLAQELAAGGPQALPVLRAEVDQRLQAIRRSGHASDALVQVGRHWQHAQNALDAGDRGAAFAALALMQRDADRLAQISERQDRQAARQRELWLAATAMLSAAVVVWAGLAMRRQRRHLGRLVRRASEDLGTGAWQTAAQSLRDDRLGAPSAFDALASGVEEVMGESERRWRTLADLAADWYWETDTLHRLAWMSGTGPLAALPGLAADDLIGQRHDQIAAFDAPADGWDRMQQVLDAQRPFRGLEFRVRAAGSAEVWVAISGRPRMNAAGQFAGYEGVGRDVTERRRAHDRLRASEQRWALMVGLASDYYWETDTTHCMQPLRPEVARRFGGMAEKSEGRTPWDAYPQAMSAEQWAAHKADIAARRPYRSVDMVIDLDDGRQRVVSISGIPRFDGAGQFLGYHGIGRDITLRREAEKLLLGHNEALQRAVAERTRELEQVNLDLDAFARQLAHELRTPIGHVQGRAHLLEARAGARLGDDERRLIDLQVQAARQMSDTVEALLHLARTTTQAMSLETVDLSALAKQVVADLPALPRQAPVEWRIAGGIQVQGSTPQLRIVLANLLGNAAKFTRQVAQPQVELFARAAANGRLSLCVRDNGAGFDMKQVDRLFKPFGRLHGGEQFQGTGIGLTIVQRIIERHGGQVSAQGEPAQGACFEFTLAVPPPGPGAPAA